MRLKGSALNGVNDVYLSKGYAQLYINDERDEAVEYRYKSQWGEVKYIFIKREIPDRIEGKAYYDLITPYGYGGPVLENVADPGKTGHIVQAFAEDFQNYCLAHDIVSELIVFHPLLQNNNIFGEIYDVSFYKETVFMDLQNEEAVWNNMKAACKNRIRKAAKQGLKVTKDSSKESLEKFIELYYRTMDKNHATDFYYFDEAYFSKLMDLNGSAEIFNVILNHKTIAGIIVLKGEQYIHYHLGATDPEYYSLSPNNLLFYEVAKWGVSQGFQRFHLGGGYSDLEDGLLRFKKNLNQNGVLKQHLGKKIQNPGIYSRLTENHLNRSSVLKDRSFFPAYRK